MLYELKQIDNQLYLQVNSGGTLEKLPKLPWYRELVLLIENGIKGSVSIARVRRYIKGVKS